MKDVSDLVELAARLVAIDSINPALVPGGAGEREIASFVAGWCAERGLEVEVVGGDRPSVIATRRGSGGGRSLLLNGHLDILAWPEWRRRTNLGSRTGGCTVAAPMT